MLISRIRQWNCCWNFPSPVLTCTSAGDKAEAERRRQFIGHCLFGKPIKTRQRVGVVPHLRKKKKEKKKTMHVRAAAAARDITVPSCLILNCLEVWDRQGKGSEGAQAAPPSPRSSQPRVTAEGQSLN